VERLLLSRGSKLLGFHSLEVTLLLPFGVVNDPLIHFQILTRLLHLIHTLQHLSGIFLLGILRNSHMILLPFLLLLYLIPILVVLNRSLPIILLRHLLRIIKWVV